MLPSFLDNLSSLPPVEASHAESPPADCDTTANSFDDYLLRAGSQPDRSQGTPAPAQPLAASPPSGPRSSGSSPDQDPNDVPAAPSAASPAPDAEPAAGSTDPNAGQTSRTASGNTPQDAERGNRPQQSGDGATPAERGQGDSGQPNSPDVEAAALRIQVVAAASSPQSQAASPSGGDTAASSSQTPTGQQQTAATSAGQQTASSQTPAAARAIKTAPRGAGGKPVTARSIADGNPEVTITADTTAAAATGSAALATTAKTQRGATDAEATQAAPAVGAPADVTTVQAIAEQAGDAQAAADGDQPGPASAAPNVPAALSIRSRPGGRDTAAPAGQLADDGAARPAATAVASLADSGAVAGLATAATLAAQPAHADHSRPAVETIASATPTAKPGGAAAGSPDAPLPTPADRAGPPGSQLPDPNGLSQADRVRFVQRVAEAFRGVGDEGGTVRLRLSPPELGSLRIDITVRKGEMTARVETETPAARNLLLDNLPALRDRLAQHDIKVQRFDVDFTDRWADQSHDPASQYQDPATYRNPASQPTQVPAGAEAEAPPALGLIAAGQPPRGGRLNIVI